jgi:hypothetical protein
MKKIIVLLALLLITGYGEEPDSTLIKIRTKHALIETAAQIFDINPNLLEAIIYVERVNNFDWKDEALDIILAKTGQNSSIGFCQVKIKFTRLTAGRPIGLKCS